MGGNKGKQTLADFVYPSRISKIEAMEAVLRLIKRVYFFFTHPIYSVKFLQSRQMEEIEDLHPNLPTDLSVFTLKTGYQKLLFSIDFIGLRHNSFLICYFPETLAF